MANQGGDMIIERYIHAFQRYLPEDVRDGAVKHLRMRIQERLSDFYTDAEVRQVLTELGDPRKLAEEYISRKKYLIGPTYYENYLSVLKCAVYSAAIASAFFGLFFLLKSIIIHQIRINLWNILRSTLFAAIENAIRALTFVTLAFILIEKTGLDFGLPPNGREWEPELLPAVPKEKQMIPRKKTVSALVILIVLTQIFYLNPSFIAIGPQSSTMLFNMSRYLIYIIFIGLLALAKFFLIIWKYVAGSWSQPLAVYNAVLNSLIAVLVIVMMIDVRLFNPDFIRSISKPFGIGPKAAAIGLDIARIIVGAGFGLHAIINSYITYQLATKP